MARGLSRIELNRLCATIRRRSRYWFSRLIEGKSSLESSAFAIYRSIEATHLSYQSCHRAYKPRTYRALLAQGFSSYEAKAKMTGIPIAKFRRACIAYQSRLRARWGGNPSHVGSEAWKRRILARFAEQT